MCGFAIFHGGNDNHLFLIRTQHESLNVFFQIGYAFAVGAIGIHHPHLVHAIGIGIGEGNFFAPIHPHGIGFAFSGVCDLYGIFAVDVHHPQFAVAVIVLNIGCAHAIEHLLGIGRHLCIAHTAEAIEQLRCELCS